MSGPPKQAELDAYSSVLLDIKERLAIAREELQYEPTRRHVEGAALQLRHCLEAIALGSLIPHEQDLDRARSALQRLDPEQARKLLRKVNPRYWPLPQVLTTSHLPDITVEMEPRDAPSIAEPDYGRWIGHTSDWLHFRARWQPPLNTVVGHTQMLDLHLRLGNTLRVFTVGMVDRSVLLLCQLEPWTGGVTVTPLTKEQASGRRS